jgi:predicted TPR repeat methyltransferase
MPEKTLDQLKEELKQKLGSLPATLADYVNEGDKYERQGDYDNAADLYNIAARMAPDDCTINKKRLDAIDAWLKP